MKRVFLLLITLALSLPLMSQDKDELLRRINQIKKDTDRYLYGLSTLPEEPNPDQSRPKPKKN